jgi:hypothetical protein
MNWRQYGSGTKGTGGIGKESHGITLHWIPKMIWMQHYHQCQNGTLKAIIETTKIEFNLPDMQVTELAI